MTTVVSLLDAIPAASRGRLLATAREVSWPAGFRIFEEDAPADRFWVLDRGRVVLDLYVPGREPAVVETLGPGQLLGWSWLVPPYRWSLGALAVEPGQALEFGATAVLGLCAADPWLGHRLLRYCGAAIGERLRAARVRLTGLYAIVPEDPT